MSGHFWKSQYLPLWHQYHQLCSSTSVFLEWKFFDSLHESIDILNFVCFNYSLHSQRGCYQQWKNPGPIFELDTFGLQQSVASQVFFGAA